MTETTKFQIGYDPKYERVLFTFGEKTLSYSSKINGWISRHDYLPDIYFNDSRKFYSAKSNKLYSHNTGDRGKFYGVVYDSIYEYVDNREPNLSKVATGLWIDSSVYDSDGDFEIDKTFDGFQIYNDYQDTQQQDITYFAEDKDNPYIGNARNTKNRWFINQFRDKNNIPDGVASSLEWAYISRNIGDVEFDEAGNAIGFEDCVFNNLAGQNMDVIDSDATIGSGVIFIHNPTGNVNDPPTGLNYSSSLPN